MSVGSTLVRGAEIRFQEAAEKLRPFVGCFWVITGGAYRVARAVSDRAAGACRHSPGRGVCPRRAGANARRSAGVRAGGPQRRQPSAPESPDAPVGRLRLQAPRDHRPLPGDASRDGAVGPTSSGFPGDRERLFRPVPPDARHRPVLRSHARRSRATRDDRFFQDPLRRASLEYRARLVRGCHGWADQSTSMLRRLSRWESRLSAWSSD